MLRSCHGLSRPTSAQAGQANNSVERGNKTLETTLQPTFRVKLITIFTQQRRVESISGVRHSVFQADQSRRGDVTSSCRERRRYQQRQQSALIEVTCQSPHPISNTPSSKYHRYRARNSARGVGACVERTVQLHYYLAGQTHYQRERVTSHVRTSQTGARCGRIKSHRVLN